jgi:hydrogenase nickel incorporation protein HypA/HybF
MHELSIAIGIIKEISLMPEIKRKKVDKVYLTVGDMSGISIESLIFGFEVAKEKTPLAESELIVKQQPIVIFCRNCKKEVRPKKYFSLECPICKRLSSKIIKGKELFIQKVEVKDGTKNYSN